MTDSTKRVFFFGVFSGFGAALAGHYAQQGALLGLVVRRQPELEKLVRGLPNASRHRVYALDVTDHAALAAAAADFIDAVGGADIVIANAGVARGTLTEYAEDKPENKHKQATNVSATVATFAPFIATMKAQARAGTPGCRLVGIGSVAGLRGLPGSGAD